MSRGENAMITRRNVLRGATAVLTTGALGAVSTRSFADTVTLPFENGERPLVKYPQKRPMIGLTSRPPQLETPFSVFNANVITPNDAFFVRYHLADVPLDIDPDAFSVEIKGKVDRATKLSLADIKKMPASDSFVALSTLPLISTENASGSMSSGTSARW